jgi:hypothetical protein
MISARKEPGYIFLIVIILITLEFACSYSDRGVVC